MKGWQILAGIIVTVVLAVYFFSRPEPVTVQLVAIERGTVDQTVANTRAGTVKACLRSRLSLPLGGQIAALHVREGDLVERNQLLMSLWSDDKTAQVAQARAQQLSADKERDSICIAASSDKKESHRQARLVEQKLTSAERADLAEARAQASAAACEAAEARLAQAHAALEVAEAVLEKTHLRAPFAGKVAEVTGEVGEFFTPSPPGVPTPPAIDLLTHDCHYISAPIDEVDASEVQLGMPVRVTLDAFRDLTLNAEIRRIAPYVLDLEKQARTVEVEATLGAIPEGVDLLAGYSVDMEIIVESHPQVLRVPSAYLLEGSAVLVLEAGVIQRRDIKTGLTNWHFTEVTEGLAEGEQIISNIGSAGVDVGAEAVASD